MLNTLYGVDFSVQILLQYCRGLFFNIAGLQWSNQVQPQKLEVRSSVIINLVIFLLIHTQYDVHIEVLIILIYILNSTTTTTKSDLSPRVFNTHTHIKNGPEKMKHFQTFIRLRNVKYIFTISRSIRENKLCRFWCVEEAVKGQKKRGKLIIYCLYTSDYISKLKKRRLCIMSSHTQYVERRSRQRTHTINIYENSRDTNILAILL